VLASRDTRLGTESLDEPITRADRQSAGLEAFRTAIVEQVLTSNAC
jgi:hypothetical protein